MELIQSKVKHETLEINTLKIDNIIHVSYYMNLRYLNTMIRYVYTFALTNNNSRVMR
jgi:DNA helicase TIP49 (TBP-interacting protein)